MQDTGSNVPVHMVENVLQVVQSICHLDHLLEVHQATRVAVHLAVHQAWEADLAGPHLL